MLSTTSVGLSLPCRQAMARRQGHEVLLNCDKDRGFAYYAVAHAPLGTAWYTRLEVCSAAGPSFCKACMAGILWFKMQSLTGWGVTWVD